MKAVWKIFIFTAETDFKKGAQSRTKVKPALDGDNMSL